MSVSRTMEESSNAPEAPAQLPPAPALSGGVTPLVAQLKDLQAQALELPLPSLPPPDSPFSPLLHPMFPSRPIHPPTLHSKVPLEICDPVCSILDLLVFNPDFSTLVSLLKIGDLVELLSTPGPITIFAPTNHAFDGLPTPLFRVIIHRHFATLELHLGFSAMLRIWQVPACFIVV